MNIREHICRLLISIFPLPINTRHHTAIARKKSPPPPPPNPATRFKQPTDAAICFRTFKGSHGIIAVALYIANGPSDSSNNLSLGIFGKSSRPNRENNIRGFTLKKHPKEIARVLLETVGKLLQILCALRCTLLDHSEHCVHFLHDVNDVNAVNFFILNFG